SIDRGRFSHPILPDALTDIALTAEADSSHLRVERFTGKCGSSTVVAAMERSGWSDEAPLALSARVLGLAFDEKLRRALPATSFAVWNRFKPRGMADAAMRARFDGERWYPELVVDCRDMSLTDAEKFPYPLERTTGRIEYHPAENGEADRLRINLVGVGGGRP